MPIYEYRCSACGHELEALQKLSEAPLTVCPSCGESQLRKQVSAAGFQLKGSGWYVTDFRDRGAKKSGKDKADKGNGASDAASDGAKSGDGAKSSDGAKPDAKSTEATTTSAAESKSSTASASKSEN